MAHRDQITFSHGFRESDSYPIEKTVSSWKDFENFIDRNRQVEKGFGYICAPFSDGHRCKASAMPSRLQMLDLDKIAPSILHEVDAWLGQFLGLAWPTHSHTQEKPRRRGVFLIDRLVNRDEMSRIGGALKSEINNKWGDKIAVDDSVFRAEQPNFLAPTHAKLIYLNGALLVADEWLARPDAISPEKSRRTVEQRVLEATKNDPVYRRLDEEGMIISPHKDEGVFNCRCPFEEEHSEHTSDSATVYYLPNFKGYPHGG
ncbi:MAG: hypothetical protein EBU01_07910, partial [Crocinitomicaceae bacterium]|nr:hypothetical protein [Crocinitomicaceae bacterium]